MIAPLLPHAIRGAIWYQGESNAGADQAYRYRRLFQTMILDWRERWGLGDFPFLFVQLANYKTDADWPILRESQVKALQLRNTGMAVTTDIGNPDDIHPRNKQDVGKRLALWALGETYGKRLVYSGPLYRQMTTEGNRVRLWFDHCGSGLKAEAGSLRGFAVAGPDHIFHPADAMIEGETVVVSSSSVSAPKAVRYAWENDPENTLRNSGNLPASPFRTDSWTNAEMPD
jgi:sialate O-acetylesterase